MKKSIFKTVSSYYSEKLLKYGATSKGVDWNDKMSHFLRFEQLDIYSNINKRFSILDYGCGFGSLIEYLNDKKYDFDYFGYDISDEMVKQARTNFPNQMFDTIIEKRKFDFVIANGIFNVKLKKTTNDWKKENLNEIEKRLTGWQLESFKESYSYKINNGISLFKKNLIKE